MLTNTHPLNPREVEASSYLTLLLENTCSDHLKATISYQVNAMTQIQKVFLPGGRSTEVNGISLEASNLRVELEYEYGEPLLLNVQHPRSAWEFGYGHLKLSGNRTEPPKATWLD
ncbi:hypothetical protein ACFONG_15915 [Uliginosibacterium paludis]|uniref:Uncharacterized protein n=1 Tax=Uliginosibacterium paludis TaxID=1615952 RepID=A0ABV2CUJ6_9RHOO